VAAEEVALAAEAGEVRNDSANRGGSLHEVNHEYMPAEQGNQIQLKLM